MMLSQLSLRFERYLASQSLQGSYKLQYSQYFKTGLRGQPRCRQKLVLQGVQHNVLEVSNVL